MIPVYQMEHARYILNRMFVLLIFGLWERISLCEFLVDVFRAATNIFCRTAIATPTTLLAPLVGFIICVFHIVFFFLHTFIIFIFTASPSGGRAKYKPYLE